MDGKIIPHDARILVSDARKALLLRNAGTAFDLALEIEHVIEAPPNASTHEQGEDRPGRAAMGSHSSGLEQAALHAHEEERFFSLVAEKVAAICATGDIEKLIVVAPPKALAQLRRTMPGGLRKRVIAEYNKDLVDLPLDKIAKRLTA